MSPPISLLLPILTLAAGLQTNELVPFETCSWAYRGNPADCGTYYQCNFGTALLRNCPPSLHWNPDVGTCDWPRNLRSGLCKDGSGPSMEHEENGLQGGTAEEDDTVIIGLRAKCEAGSFRKSTRDCGTFFICNHGSYVAQQCGAGLHWNAAQSVCDWPSNAGCASGPEPGTVPPPAPPTAVPTQSPVNPLVPVPVPVEPKPVPATPGTKVICYFTDWAWYRPGPTGKFLPSHIDPSLCTHVVYAFALLSANDWTIQPADSWADYDNHFYSQVTALKSKGVKVTLALGGWNESGGNKYSVLVNDPAKRARFIGSVLAYLDKYGFDGLDLDWEYPECWQGACDKGPGSDKGAFAALVRELRAALPDGAILSAAVSASKVIIDAGYDVPTLSKYLDWIGVMDYDFHGPWEKTTGHIAPLYYNPGDALAYLNVNYSIHYWLEAGAAKEKLIMGIPLYGQTWTLANPAVNGLNAPAYGPGEAGTYTRQGGVLAYYEICGKAWTKSRQSPTGTMGPYSYSGNQWVSYDDVPMVTKKSEYIKEHGLGGGMIWALDFDDFTNSCGQGRYPLLSAISNTLRA